MTISHGSPARGPAPIRGRPNLRDQLLVLPRGDLRQADLGDVGQGAGRGLDVLLAQQVAHADAQLLVVLEAVQDRIDVLGRRGTVRRASRACASRVGSLSSTRLSISPSSMPGLLVRMPDRYGL